jgi:hypothetical protein
MPRMPSPSRGQNGTGPPEFSRNRCKQAGGRVAPISARCEIHNRFFLRLWSTPIAGYEHSPWRSKRDKTSTQASTPSTNLGTATALAQHRKIRPRLPIQLAHWGPLVQLRSVPSEKE